LQALAELYPNNVAVRLTFCDHSSHLIEAGSDLFAMPSRYEPCGLNQMYSLAYGTVPIVRQTGGLADTITHPTPDTLADGTANGFSFRDADPNGLNWAIGQAIRCYKTDRPTWQRLMLNGMGQDFSWQHSALQYIDFYEKCSGQ
ncbi:MAG: glycosyltransferase, partial [Planctomycetaceae bacterium]|nr:glycosyltransferase [Planctomycetaceae bacterium]